MSEHLDFAKQKLTSGDFTCVIEHYDKLFTSKERGIKPIMDWLREGGRGGVCADRVIGKAAAMLLCYGGVREIYAGVISSHALDFLSAAGVLAEYGKKVDYIINRAGDGMCPMETRALSLDTAQTAFELFDELIQINN